MDAEIDRRMQLCDSALEPDWEDVVLMAKNLDDVMKAFLMAHPPGLIAALWRHFEATRDRCGCASAMHERPDCQVRLVERLLIDQESQ